MFLAQAVRTAPIPAAERPLDLVHLARQTMGDRQVEREVLAIFRSQARLMMFRLEATTDPRGRVEVAHLLNGAARAVGARRVASAATQLETAASAGMPLGTAIVELAESVHEAITEIDALLSDN